MTFNADKFERAKFTPREKVVEVPALADFFDGGPAEWKVRGLSANELYKAMEAKSKISSTESIVKALSANGDQVTALRKALGMSLDTPGEIAKRLEMLVVGSVAPVIELPVAVKLAETFPIEFMMLTNEISMLTGQGAEVAKPAAASQKTKPSTAA